jgi:hypothetical protein
VEGQTGITVGHEGLRAVEDFDISTASGGPRQVNDPTGVSPTSWPSTARAILARLPHPDRGYAGDRQLHARSDGPYETEDHYLGVPTAGLARDWRVERLRLGRWALTPTPNGHGDYSVGSLLQVEDTPRMHRWADDSDADSQHLAYLLDLHTT